MAIKTAKATKAETSKQVKTVRITPKSICETVGQGYGIDLTEKMVREECRGGLFESWDNECWAIAALMTGYKKTNTRVGLGGKSMPASPTSRQLATWLCIDVSKETGSWEEYRRETERFKRLGVFHEMPQKNKTGGFKGRPVICLTGASSSQALLPDSKGKVAALLAGTA